MFGLRSVTDVLWTYWTRTSVVTRAALLRSRAADPKHLLLVSWGFPPFFATGIQITTSFARDAANLGWRVSVLCGPEPPDGGSVAGKELLQSLPSSVRLVRVPLAVTNGMELHIAPSTRVTPKIDGNFVTAIAMADLGLARFAADPPAAIVAFGPRFSNFVTALYLARGLGPRTRLVLGYSDEWTVQTQAFVSAGPEDQAWEGDCLRRADMVAFATQGKREAYRAGFPFLETKPCLVVPCGWGPENYDASDPGPCGAASGPQGEFVLAFVGRAAPNTPMIPFLADLDAALETRPDLLAALRFLLVGRQLPAVLEAVERFERAHPGAIRLHHEVSARRAVAMQLESGALLMLANTPYPGVVPLKLFDYMRSGRPILAYGTTSEAASVVADTGSGVVVAEGDRAGLIRALDALIKGDPAAWWTPRRAAWVDDNRRDRLNARFLDEIGTLAAGPVEPNRS